MTDQRDNYTRATGTPYYSTRLRELADKGGASMSPAELWIVADALEAAEAERDALRETLHDLTEPPLIFAADDATQVAAWFVERAAAALDGTQEDRTP